jgi:hypothetical protein
MLVFRGIWMSLLRLGVELGVVEFQRAGDEVRGDVIEDVGPGLGLGLDDLEELLAMNLSRKCCSQSAEGIVFLFCWGSCWGGGGRC